MIEHASLLNFKACRDIDLRVAPLTVLAGKNSSGKSSLMQSIALLRQSCWGAGTGGCLKLSGELLQLGHGRDVLSEGSESINDEITFEFRENGELYSWMCQSEPDACELQFRSKPEALPCFVKDSMFQYLQANRITPAVLYPQAPTSSASTGFLGAHGEHTADFLAVNMDQIVRNERLVSRCSSVIDGELLGRVAPTSKLFDQVSAWLQCISPGARLACSRVDGTDEVLLQFNYAGLSRTSKSNNYRPTNVGFGLTYCLPILVSCLAASSGGLLLLENPEAHLHPQGQVALGELLALAASDGVQIVVETHSDHLLNGVRLAVKREKIRCIDTAIHFFSRSVDTGDSTVQSPVVMSNGRLSNWPDGFFDQWDKSLEALVE